MILLIVISSASWSIYPVYRALWVVWVNIFLVNSTVIMLIKTLLILVIRHLHQTSMRSSSNKKRSDRANQYKGQNNYRVYGIKNNTDNNTCCSRYCYHWNHKSKHGNINPIANTTTFWRITDIFFSVLRRAGLSSAFHLVTSCVNRLLIGIVRKSITFLYIIHHLVSICYHNSRGLP